MKTLWFIIFLPFLAFSQEAEQNNPSDTSRLAFHQKSMLYSAIIPGAGQIRNSYISPLHNNAYWKVPLIYAGVGAAGYFLVSNQQMQKAYKTEYSHRQYGGSLNPDFAIYDDPAILQLYNQYLDWRDLSILGLAAVYLIQVAEAGAEAHFVHFETSPDLSFQVNPYFSAQGYVGASLSLRFH